MQLQVLNSPFNEEQVELLNRLLPQLSGGQYQWLSGYLTALHNAGISLGAEAALQAGAAALAVPPTAAVQPAIGQSQVSDEITVLYGSQTGNSQRLAESFSQKLKNNGYKVQLASMGDFKPNSLKKVKNLFIIVSTHGEGDPPDNAISFYEFLHGRRAPQLEDLQFSVLALGDRSYEFFCQTGKEFDERLEELGGNRLAPRIDCDLDYDELAEEWMEDVIQALHAAANPQALTNGTGHLQFSASSQALPDLAAVADEPVYSRTRPFLAEVLENINLNGRGSTQETRHLELSLEGSNFQFEPGDCVGIYPQNHPDLVDELIAELALDPNELVPINKHGDERSLRDALQNHYELTVLTKHLIEQVSQLVEHNGLKELLKPGQEQELKGYLTGRDVLDLAQDYALKGVSAKQFVSLLRKLPARLYSIASSYKANPDEVHLTVRVVRYESHGRERYGVCSVQCAERLQPGDTLPIYVHHNPNFKLPADPDQPIIMIGPGTGVAPYRAFLEEREELGAEGKTWLFFGDRNFVTDFLYQTDWQRWLKEGVLTRMDVAFSRDTPEKIYVQHRMLERSKELYEWLEEGAAVYVCGDEVHMASDVHATLLHIIEQEGGKTAEEAAAYLTELQSQKRYQRDVY